MFDNIRSFLGLATRRDGTLWKSTPYSLGAGLLGLLGWQANVQLHWQVPGGVHALIALFVAFLLFKIIDSATIVFRDARQYLGSIRNGVRDLARLMSTCVSDEEDQKVLKRWLILVGELVRRDLQGTGHDDLVAAQLLTPNESALLSRVDAGKRTYYVLRCISDKLNSLFRAREIDGNQWFVIDGHISAVNAAFGACQRAQLAQLPPDFSVVGGYSLCVFIILLPLVLAPETHELTSLVMFMLGYVLVGMLKLSQEVSDPFGNDPNDLDVFGVVENVRSDVKLMFDTEQPKPPQEAA